MKASDFYNTSSILKHSKLKMYQHFTHSKESAWSFLLSIVVLILHSSNAAVTPTILLMCMGLCIMILSSLFIGSIIMMNRSTFPVIDYTDNKDTTHHMIRIFSGFYFIAVISSFALFSCIISYYATTIPTNTMDILCVGVTSYLVIFSLLSFVLKINSTLTFYLFQYKVYTEQKEKPDA